MTLRAIASMGVLFIAAIVTALAAALRSTWSPCGWSMLSTLTPVSERAKGHRYSATVAWFIGGATLGGAITGGVAAAFAAVVGSAELSVGTRLWLGALACAAASLFDLRVARPELPHMRRQVNEQWLDEFRRWVYAGGFGAQIGSGFATYIMTAAVYLVPVLAALTASPSAALIVGIIFGLARGTVILAAAGASTPEMLLHLHRRFDALTETVQAGVATGLVGMAAGLVFLALIGLESTVITIAAVVVMPLAASLVGVSNQSSANGVAGRRPIGVQS